MSSITEGLKLSVASRGRYMSLKRWKHSDNSDPLTSSIPATNLVPRNAPPSPSHRRSKEFEDLSGNQKSVGLRGRQAKSLRRPPRGPAPAPPKPFLGSRKERSDTGPPAAWVAEPTRGQGSEVSGRVTPEARRTQTMGRNVTRKAEGALNGTLGRRPVRKAPVRPAPKKNPGTVGPREGPASQLGVTPQTEVEATPTSPHRAGATPPVGSKSASLPFKTSETEGGIEEEEKARKEEEEEEEQIDFSGYEFYPSPRPKRRSPLTPPKPRPPPPPPQPSPSPSDRSTPSHSTPHHSPPTSHTPSPHPSPSSSLRQQAARTLVKQREGGGKLLIITPSPGSDRRGRIVFNLPPPPPPPPPQFSGSVAKEDEKEEERGEEGGGEREMEKGEEGANGKGFVKQNGDNERETVSLEEREEEEEQELISPPPPPTPTPPPPPPLTPTPPPPVIPPPLPNSPATAEQSILSNEYTNLDNLSSDEEMVTTDFSNMDCLETTEDGNGQTSGLVDQTSGIVGQMSGLADQMSTLVASNHDRSRLANETSSLAVSDHQTSRLANVTSSLAVSDHQMSRLANETSGVAVSADVSLEHVGTTAIGEVSSDQVDAAGGDHNDSSDTVDSSETSIKEYIISGVEEEEEGKEGTEGKERDSERYHDNSPILVVKDPPTFPPPDELTFDPQTLKLNENKNNNTEDTNFPPPPLEFVAHSEKFETPTPIEAYGMPPEPAVADSSDSEGQEQEGGVVLIAMTTHREDFPIVVEIAGEGVDCEDVSGDGEHKWPQEMKTSESGVSLKSIGTQLSELDSMVTSIQELVADVASLAPSPSTSPPPPPRPPTFDTPHTTHTPPQPPPLTTHTPPLYTTHTTRTPPSPKSTVPPKPDPPPVVYSPSSTSTQHTSPHTVKPVEPVSQSGSVPVPDWASTERATSTSPAPLLNSVPIPPPQVAGPHSVLPTGGVADGAFQYQLQMLQQQMQQQMHQQMFQHQLFQLQQQFSQLQQLQHSLHPSLPTLPTHPTLPTLPTLPTHSTQHVHTMPLLYAQTTGHTHPHTTTHPTLMNLPPVVVTTSVPPMVTQPLVPPGQPMAGLLHTQAPPHFSPPHPLTSSTPNSHTSAISEQGSLNLSPAIEVPPTSQLATPTPTATAGRRNSIDQLRSVALGAIQNQFDQLMADVRETDPALLRKTPEWDHERDSPPQSDLEAALAGALRRKFFAENHNQSTQEIEDSRLSEWDT